MRVLMFHGYLLRGTGSNVYNAELGAALARAGHEVHLLCQEPEPFGLSWVDAVGDWREGRLEVVARRQPVRAVVYRPPIGPVLPVYVADRYAGFDAKPFPALSDAELDGYVAANVTAVRQVARRVRPDVALANHLVMGPLVLARALAGLGVPYAVKIHGSALEYTVRPHPRFLAPAREGLAGARGILVGSRHVAERLWDTMADSGLAARTRLGPPGVDVDRFAPRDPDLARAGVRRLTERLATGDERAGAAGEEDSAFARDPRAAARALASVGPADRLVVFVGKLIASKGVELLLAAWPLVLRRVPDARLLVVGFGAAGAHLESFAARLATGELTAGAALRQETGEPFAHLSAFLERLAGEPARSGSAVDADSPARASPADGSAVDGASRKDGSADAYGSAARGLADRVAWTGRLEHPELAELLPAAEALVVPSTFPEAFGMVAAEGAACGALPVVARHSGLAEVADTLAEVLPAEARRWLTFDLGPHAVEGLAAALVGWLEAPAPMQAAVRAAMVDVTRERYSWAGVAQGVLAAAQGELDALPPASAAPGSGAEGPVPRRPPLE